MESPPVAPPIEKDLPIIEPDQQQIVQLAVPVVVPEPEPVVVKPLPHAHAPGRVFRTLQQPVRPKIQRPAPLPAEELAPSVDNNVGIVAQAGDGPMYRDGGEVMVGDVAVTENGHQLIVTEENIEKDAKWWRTRMLVERNRGTNETT